MKNCEVCRVLVDDHLAECPLCHKSLGSITQDTDGLYPQYDTSKIVKKFNFIYRLCLFLSIVICSSSTLINLLTFKQTGRLWFIYIIVSILYLWLFIGNTILSKTNGGAKILLQCLSLSAIFLSYDITTGFHRWSVNFVIPFLVIAATLLISIIIITKKMLWNAYISYTITMIFVGFIPILLYVVRVATTLWPSTVAALYALLTLCGMFIFADKRSKNAFTRRFHF